MFKPIILAIGSCLILSSCVSSQTSKNQPTQKQDNLNAVVDYAETISAEDLKELLTVYASDEFEGRNTGEKGQKMAVEFLKSKYETLNIPAALGGSNYFQKVGLEKRKIAEANVGVNNQVFKAFEDQIVLYLSESLNVSTDEIVYVGYGIDTESYSDYKGLDVKGKVVLAKVGEPKDDDGNYVTSGSKKESRWTSGREAITSKRNAARDNGARVLLYLDDTLFSRYASFYKRRAKSNAAGRLGLADPNTKFSFLMINEKLGESIHPNISNDHQPKTVSTAFSITANKNDEVVDSENVVAYIKGSEKPDEILVISAHLDHIGKKGDKIYNGADDDGSGTVAVLEIAEAFKQAQNAGYTPKRSVLFLHVTGEEKGLLGSQYYTDIDPIFPLDQTIANLNIDMIGRTDPKRGDGKRNYVYLIGSDKLSTELHELSEAVNSKCCQIELDYTYNDENDPNRYYYRSDHYNFAKNDIPVIFYFNGTHADYHQASDTVDKIEFDLLENRTRLVFYTAWELVNRAERIKLDKAFENVERMGLKSNN